MLRFVLVLCIAFLEIGSVTVLLQKFFGRAALKRNIMHVICGFMLLGLFCKGWFDTAGIQWFAINVILFFLLSVFYRGDMKNQAVFAVIAAIVATGLDAALKLLLLPML